MVLSNLPYIESDLIPASTIQTEEQQREFQENHQRQVKLYSEIVSLCKKHEINPAYIYLTPKHMETYCYYDFPLFLSIGSFDDTYFTFMEISKRVKINSQIMKKALEEKDVAKILSFSDDNVKTLLLNKLYWILPEDEQYQMWMEIYQRIDYGHNYMEQKMIQDAISKQSDTYRKKMLKRLNYVETGDILTVYRGIGEASTEPSKAMSWTTSLSVACYFASRYERNGKVYQATIHKEHVIDYLTNRREEEILLKPQYLQGIHEYPMISIDEEMEILSSEGYIDEYCTYRNSYIEESDYHKPNGIHGIPHVKRVLFHCMAMSKHLNLSDSERAILANSAVYHDIGRKHDDYCTEHGVWSWRKLKRKMEKSELNFLSEVNYVEPYKKGVHHYNLRLLTKEEREIIRFIIEYHCRDDQRAKRDLSNIPIKDKEKAWKLFEIFKDCDGKDRIRLSKDDLDVSYLRTEIAKKRVLIAHILPRVKQL